VYRLAEGGNQASETPGEVAGPDGLSERNAADLRGISFMANDAPDLDAAPSVRSFLAPLSSQSSILTRYCVTRVRGPFAPYLSCQTFMCDCASYVDRCLGERNVTGCDLTKPAAHCDRVVSEGCNGTSASIDNVTEVPLQSILRTIGRQSVASGVHMTPPVAPPKGCALDDVQKVDAGYWYSLPRAGECEPDRYPPTADLEPRGERASTRTDTCTWSHSSTTPSFTVPPRRPQHLWQLYKALTGYERFGA